MTDKQLNDGMTVILRKLQKNSDINQTKKLIASAVTLGMKYQEELIKTGIDTIFEEIHKK